MSPFNEDEAVCRLAENLGLALSRYEAIEITDQAAITAAGLVKTSPDYAAIRKALRDGEDVPGARVIVSQIEGIVSPCPECTGYQQ